jgi:hypothetical protein
LKNRRAGKDIDSFIRDEQEKEAAVASKKQAVIQEIQGLQNLDNDNGLALKPLKSVETVVKEEKFDLTKSLPYMFANKKIVAKKPLQPTPEQPAQSDIKFGH